MRLVTTSLASAGDIDRAIADVRTPAEIRWVHNPAGTNEQAILVWGMGPATATPAEKKTP